MLTEPIDLLPEQPDWIRVLAAYAAAEKALPVSTEEPAAEDPEADEESSRSQKWLPRVEQVEDVHASLLHAIHGQLIAHGLLKFDLADRTDGVVYRLTAQSRSAVNKVNLDELPVSEAVESDAEEASELMPETEDESAALEAA